MGLWLSVALAFSLHVHDLIISTIIALSSAFTLLAVGHVVAFLWRLRRVVALKAENRQDIAVGDYNRRRFLTRSGGLALGSLLAFVLGRTSPAQAVPTFALYCLYEAQNTCPPYIQGDLVCIPCYGPTYPGTGEGATPSHPCGRLGSERLVVIDHGPFHSTCVLRLKLVSTLCVPCLTGKTLIPAPPAPPPFDAK